MYDTLCTRPGCENPAPASEERVPLKRMQEVLLLEATEVIETVQLCNSCLGRAEYENRHAQDRMRPA